MSEAARDLTRLLQQGDLQGEVLGLVYEELRRLARGRMGVDRPPS